MNPEQQILHDTYIKDMELRKKARDQLPPAMLGMLALMGHNILPMTFDEWKLNHVN